VNDRQLRYSRLMPHVYVDQLKQHVGQPVVLKGWLYNMASKGKLHFLQVRDGTGIVQAVMSKAEVGDEVFARAAGLKQEASIILTGTVREDARSPIGVELGVQNLELVHQPTAEFPISPKEHGTAFLMEQRHLWLRSRKQVAVLRVRAEIIQQIRNYFDSRGFVLMDAPIFTPSACEGTTNLFEVDYFDEKAYLTQSGQLYGEAGAMALGRIYTFGPTFRAEKSKTRRHLTEFWMVEPEVAFLDLEGDMALAEDFLVEVVKGVLENRRAELQVLERDLTKLEKVQKPFPRIRYEEAIELLHKKGKEAKFGDDFGADEETAISEEFDRPVMIHRYPAAIKAFYMKRDPADARLALALDVIAPDGYGEIIGGAQREDDLATLEARITEHNLPRAAFEWYLDLRRYGSVPHAGFGLGVERTVQWICGLHHVRETIPFPRMMGKIEP
jgi:asparaginyl-tRNA synthetase